MLMIFGEMENFTRREIQCFVSLLLVGCGRLYGLKLYLRALYNINQEKTI